jgi:two-component system cell cycle response regulator
MLQPQTDMNKCELLERMNSSIELNRLLDLLGEEIENLGLVDGYLLNLRDAASENLYSLKVRFTPEFRSLEDTYSKYKISLKGEHINVSGRAFISRQVVQVNHGIGGDEEKKLLELWHLDEITAIPLLEDSNTQDKPNGTLLLLKQKGSISEDALNTLSGLVSLFYKPLRNAIEFSFLKDYHDRFEAAAAEHARFLQFIVEMSNLTSYEKIFEMFLVELFRQLKFDVIGFFVLEDGVLASRNVAAKEPAYQSVLHDWKQQLASSPYLLNATDGGVSHTFLRNTTLLFPDVQKILHLPMSIKDQRTLATLKTVRTLLMIPIRYQNKPIGVIAFFSLSASLPVSESDLHLLENLSSFLGTAITNSRNYELSLAQNREIERLNRILQNRVKELGEQAATDSLTGLFNFRTFEHELDRRLNEFTRQSDRSGLSIAVIDIDHFKKFNDTYGHAAGNIVLTGVAREITKLVRKMDLACRYGGEEFVVILSKCDLEGIKVFSERLRQSIENASFETDTGRLSVTVSIGCTTFEVDDTNESIFKRADQALYRAKANGRNRIESAQAE